MVPELGRQTSCACEKKKDVFMNCQRCAPEIFGNVHADTVYRWKLDGLGGCPGRPKKITGAVAEKADSLDA